MNIIENKSQTAIVVVGYNRLDSLKRLLSSLEQSQYDGDTIPLIISIDASGNEELYNFVKAYNWIYGPCYVNIQTQRLGLKKHILQCGNLTRFFKSIVLLEDDIVVSPYFYKYVKTAVEYYSSDKTVAQISLYRNEVNGFVHLPFEPRYSGADVFLMQDISTWGECWTEDMWNDFIEWYDQHDENYVNKVRMPEKIKKWTRAWSKYYYAYIIDTRKYVLFPYISLTTNYSEAGEHDEVGTISLQTNMLYGEMTYTMRDSTDLERYDAYCNNEILYESLSLEKDQLELDLYGYGELDNSKQYLLSTQILPYKVVKSFSLCMRPIEQNVISNILGRGIYLYDKSVLDKAENKENLFLAFYYIRGVRTSLILGYLRSVILSFIRKRLKL
mgnify:FL=1